MEGPLLQLGALKAYLKEILNFLLPGLLRIIVTMKN